MDVIKNVLSFSKVERPLRGYPYSVFKDTSFRLPSLVSALQTLLFAPLKLKLESKFFIYSLSTCIALFDVGVKLKEMGLESTDVIS